MNYICWDRFIIATFLSTVLIFVAGYLKIDRGVKTGYTRKLCHFGNTVILAVIIGTLPDMEAKFTSYLWSAGRLLTFILFCMFPRNLVLRYPYEAYARESDVPNRTFFILVPTFLGYISTIISSFFFPVWVSKIGIYALGFGDGIAEPVGVLLGKHKYQVKSMLSKTVANRSLEGSFAVFLVSVISAVYVLATQFPMVNWPVVFIWGICVGIIAASVEAFSPHGSDNFTIPLAVSSFCLGIFYIAI
jgi:phytol kinase